MPSEPGATEMMLRPQRLGRVVGWFVFVFGAVFGVSGLVEPDDRVTLVVMALAGAAFSAVGLSLATSRACVSPTGIRYRNGLHRAHVPAQDVLAFNVGPGSGAPPPRIAYVVERQGRRPLRLTGVQRWDSADAREDMASEAAQVSDLLGLTPERR